MLTSSMISIIVPAYNDPDGVRSTVLSLLNQEGTTGPYEIIVVDNGSTDDTFEAARELELARPGMVRAAVEASMRTSYGARNKGIAMARGDILCFLDANMTAEPLYVEKIREAFSSDDVQYLGCSVLVHSDRRTLTSKFDRARGFPMARYLANKHFVGAGCLCIRREVLDAVGGFDGRLESSGDLEYGQRVHAAGFKQQFAAHIELRHPARSRYMSLVRKRLRLGRGIAQLSHFYPERYGAAYRRYLQIRGYLPEHPPRLASRYAAAGIDLRPLEVAALSVWRIPLSWVALYGFLSERLRLRLRGGRANPEAQHASARPARRICRPITRHDTEH